MKTIRKKYRVIKDILSASGFAWNEIWKTIECDDDVWTRYVTGMRGKSIEMLDELNIVCGVDQATGQWARDGIDSSPYVVRTSSRPMESNTTGSSHQSGKRTKRSKNIKAVNETMGVVTHTIRRLIEAIEPIHNVVNDEALVQEVEKLEEVDEATCVIALEFLNDNPTKAKTFMQFSSNERRLFFIFRHLSDYGIRRPTKSALFLQVNIVLKDRQEGSTNSCKMSQGNQETNTASPVNLPVKRKRGRPRKDLSLAHGEKTSVTPGSDVMKRSRRRKVDPTDNTNNSMVGQVVSGVLEGSFDAGYLLTVRVGNTDTVLRGVVFEPGLSVPVSLQNDVAPHVKMFKRNEIPLPVVEPQTLMHGSTPQCDQKTKPPVKLLQRNEGAIPSKVSPPVNQNQMPRIVNQVSPSKLMTGAPVALKGIAKDSSHVPQVAPPGLHQAEVKSVSSPCPPLKKLSGDINQVVQVSLQAAESQMEKKKSIDKLPMKETGLSPAEVDTNQYPLIKPQQNASELKNQSASVSEPLEHNRTAKLAEVLLENEVSTLRKGPSNDVDAPKGLKVEPKPEPPAKIMQGNESIGQAMGSELKSDELVHDTLKGPYLELNYTLGSAAPQSVVFEPTSEPGMMLQENQAFPKCDNPQDIQAELSVKISGRDETSHLNERPLNDSTQRTECVRMTYQPVEMLQREDIPSAPYDSEAEPVGKQSIFSDIA
ncbi:hypothetical protein HHK36_023866 [Tetracentron sinense]|uniref:Myb/SANT-like domain-containing protein n=1 Tax=Tetracentron sinense TaxID=13715 RepID=A0A834YQY3_TETSI|nr:hypothetical protein HHK36_023866 [Tetracentron sinense]